MDQEARQAWDELMSGGESLSQVYGEISKPHNVQALGLSSRQRANVLKGSILLVFGEWTGFLVEHLISRTVQRLKVQPAITSTQSAI
jgi:hypothetical protein